MKTRLYYGMEEMMKKANEQRSNENEWGRLPESNHLYQIQRKNMKKVQFGMKALEKRQRQS